MNRIFLFIIISLIFWGCKTNQEITNNEIDYPKNAYNSIKAEDLKKHLYQLASDEFEGRESGTEGQKKAAAYLMSIYQSFGIVGGVDQKDDYFQEIPANTYTKAPLATENVLAFIPGSEFPDEVLVITAHYDHLGIHNGKIHYGADDDASGTSAILEIAEAFQTMVKQGKGPKRSILFMHVTAEEKGLYGSKYYSENPIYPLKNTITNLNIDMIGRVDDEHLDNKNYLYLIGSDKLSTELHDISEAVNAKTENFTLDYRFDAEDDPNRFYYRSDHYNFAKHNVPVIFYFNGVHADYHEPTDTPDKIDYDLLAKRTKLIFATAWELANRAKRPKLD